MDEINAAYQRGYRAGKVIKQKRLAEQREAKRRQAFTERVFIAVLPWAMSCQNWKMNDVQVASPDDRIDLALRIARMSATRKF
jgi:hypothetical protein